MITGVVWLAGHDLARLTALFRGSGYGIVSHGADLPAVGHLGPRQGEAPVILWNTRAGDPVGERAAIEQFRARTTIPLVIMAEALSLARFHTVMLAGADGYVGADVAAEELWQLIALVAAGEKVMPRTLVLQTLSGPFRAA